jgi:hypothetical protein
LIQHQKPADQLRYQLHPPTLHPLVAKTCTFSAEQIASLSAPLDRAKVRQRRQGRSQVSYMQGWQAIAEANRIFGIDGWQRETVALRCVHQAERPIGEEQRPGWVVTYTARVRISVTAGHPALVRPAGQGPLRCGSFPQRHHLRSGARAWSPIRRHRKLSHSHRRQPQQQRQLASIPA